MNIVIRNTMMAFEVDADMGCTTRYMRGTELVKKTSAGPVETVAKSIAEREAWDELPMLADALDEAGIYPQLAEWCRTSVDSKRRALAIHTVKLL